MPTVLPMTRVEAYLAYKAGVIAESDLKPSLKTNFYSGLENWLAYWCGLTADYPKDENNNPKWYTEEEYYVAYLCGIAPDYPVNCYRRVGAYLRYIISARWDRPEKPLTREEYYLSLMSTTYLPPNEPASVISIDGTAEAPFGDLKIFGDTTQDTLTGKNLFDFNDVSALRCSYTRSGNILSVSATGDNPSLTLTFTKPIVAGTYTASSSENIGTATLSPRDDNNSSLNVNFTASQVPKTMTFSNDAYYLTIYTTYTTGQSFTLDFSKFQIESGSTDTSYEPYCGGIPSPNPDYPQPIQVVTGEQTVKVVGKNLIDTNALERTLPFSSTNHGINFTLADDGSITLNGKNDSTGASVFSIYNYATPLIIAGGTYAGDLHPADNVYRAVSMIVYDGAHYRGFRQASVQSLDASRALCYLQVANGESTQFTDYKIYPQLEVGSTDTPYEPYQGQSYEINLGKNLFDSTSSSVTSVNGGSSQSIESGIRVTTTTGSANGFCVFLIDKAQKYLGKTITLSANMEASSTNYPRIYIGFCNAAGTSRTSLVTMDSSGSISYTVTTTDDTKPYLMLAMYCSAAISTDIGDYVDYTNIQLEIGSTATPYAPYFTPIELAKVDNSQDYIWKDGDTWKVHKATGKVVLDGSETDWGIQNNVFRRFFADVRQGALGEEILVISDHFTGRATCYRGDIGNGKCAKIVGNNQQVAFRYDALNGDVSAWTTWLSTHNTTVYYVLATPTDTAIADETLIGQLEALLEGGSYAPQTNIVLTAVDPNLPGLLQVTAAKWQ